MIHTISNFWLKSVLAMAKKLAVTSEGFEDVVQEGNMGLFMCLTELCGCGDEIDVEKELLDAAAAENVKVYGMSENMVEATMRKATVLLGFGSIDEAEMQEGLRRLQKAWL